MRVQIALLAALSASSFLHSVELTPDIIDLQAALSTHPLFIGSNNRFAAWAQKTASLKKVGTKEQRKELKKLTREIPARSNIMKEMMTLGQSPLKPKKEAVEKLAAQIQDGMFNECVLAILNLENLRESGNKSFDSQAAHDIEDIFLRYTAAAGKEFSKPVGIEPPAPEQSTARRVWQSLKDMNKRKNDFWEAPKTVSSINLIDSGSLVHIPYSILIHAVETWISVITNAETKQKFQQLLARMKASRIAYVSALISVASRRCAELTAHIHAMKTQSIIFKALRGEEQVLNNILHYFGKTVQFIQLAHLEMPRIEKDTLTITSASVQKKSFLTKLFEKKTAEAPQKDPREWFERRPVPLGQEIKILFQRLGDLMVTMADYVQDQKPERFIPRLEQLKKKLEDFLSHMPTVQQETITADAIEAALANCMEAMEPVLRKNVIQASSEERVVLMDALKRLNDFLTEQLNVWGEEEKKIDEERKTRKLGPSNLHREKRNRITAILLKVRAILESKGVKPSELQQLFAMINKERHAQFFIYKTFAYDPKTDIILTLRKSPPTLIERLKEKTRELLWNFSQVDPTNYSFFITGAFDEVFSPVEEKPVFDMTYPQLNALRDQEKSLLKTNVAQAKILIPEIEKLLNKESGESIAQQMYALMVHGATSMIRRAEQIPAIMPIQPTADFAAAIKRATTLLAQ